MCYCLLRRSVCSLGRCQHLPVRLEVLCALERARGEPGRLQQIVLYTMRRAIQFAAHGEISIRANVEQTRIYRRFIAFMDQVDVLICPACAVSPFPHEQLYVAEINGEAMDTYMRWLAITYGITMTTHPVALLPCGRDDRGLPFGIQVVGHYRRHHRKAVHR